MGEESSGLHSLLVILGCAGGGVWGGGRRQVFVLARRRGWGKWLHYALSLVAGIITAFGAVFLLGALLMPNPEGAAAVAGGLGALLLAPFAWLQWRNRQDTRASTDKRDSMPRFAAGSLQPEPEQLAILLPPPLALKKPPRLTETSAEMKTMPMGLPHRFRITYPDKAISWTKRDVRVDSISSNGSRTFLVGFCELRRDTRTFRTDRIRGNLLDLETGEVLPLQRLLSDVLERSTSSCKSSGGEFPKDGANREWQQAAFFAGFSSPKRIELEGLAGAAGWQVRQTISSTVTYVVAGSMVGKIQLSQADNAGVPVINEAEFFELL